MGYLTSWLLIFFFFWAIRYIYVMIAMSIDNLCWTAADYKWYGTNEWKKHFKVLFITPGKARREWLWPKTEQGWEIWKGRIKDVWTHQYDILPAMITSLIMTIELKILLWIL